MIKPIDEMKTISIVDCAVDECLELLRAMADKTRKEIIMVFKDAREISVNDIANQFTLSRPTNSHHLNLMRRAKLLKSRKDGKTVYYSVNKEYITNMLTSMLNLINSCC